jgi:epoxyqueuosine reductase
LKDHTSITNLLGEFTKTSHLNRVEELDNLTIFDEPVVGIASAQDSLFNELKGESVIGNHHLLPTEWLPGAVSVASYFLPFSSRVRKTNRLDGRLPSTEWLYGRIEGEKFNNAVKNFLIDNFAKEGVRAIAPNFDTRYKVNGYSSNWSERHVAFIAGLGTFNLSKAIITEKGCAGRFGSVIVDLALQPVERPYNDIYEYCNNCGACIQRCPVQAITEKGKEHVPCDKFLSGVTAKLFAPRYGCGKCQTAVPCEAGIPRKNER